MLEIIQAEINELDDASKELLSDGAHSFKELYEHRCLLYISLVNILCVWSEHKGDFTCTKAILHSDGTSYKDMFLLVVENNNTQEQISYHIPSKYWEMVECESSMFAPDYDNHTSAMVLERLRDWFGGRG